MGDVVAEVYGFKAFRRAIVTTFALLVFAAGCFWLIIALPGAEWYGGQDAFVRTLAPVPLIVLACLLGFLFKSIVEIVLSPVTIWVIGRVKQAEPAYAA